jgi:hypothetical protein
MEAERLNDGRADDRAGRGDPGGLRRHALQQFAHHGAARLCEPRLDDHRVSVNQHIDNEFALLSQQMKTMEDNIMRALGNHEISIPK